jgi:hypothetical protein
MTLIHRYIEQVDPNGKQFMKDIFSYVMFQTVNSSNGCMEAALIVDIKFDAISESIKMININETEEKNFS